ncbi:efflux RND transporter permease subunit [Aestuariibacter salexigens]|uniref:efflux RND transporter permease subunit n=1 Tax=Aestuariibacter salexigens TaxID=226010 RepID=UPI0003F6AB9C|nr:efflux RND transporter permease subunit [Aestuariibacter salexigens]
MQHRAPLPWYSLFFRRGHLLVLSIIIILVAGLSAVKNLPRLEDPRIDTRNALVLTSYPGASAERVEALVTDVLEDELRQLFEIKEIKSTSRSGISILRIELQDWIDNSSNEQVFSKIRDSLGDAAQRFPAGAGEPELDEKRGATAFTMLLSVKPYGQAPTDLTIMSRMADELADRLRNVPGTELVRMYGDPEEEIIVTVDQQELAIAGLTIQQVSAAINAADPKLPAGILHTGKQDIRIQVAQELDSLDVIRNIPLRGTNASYLRLGDIASVTRGWREPVSDIALLDGERVVFVGARMQPTVRVDKWTENALRTVELFNHDFHGTVTAEVSFEQNRYTHERLVDLTENLLMGSLVVMLVILVFMGLKASFIVGLALPLCAAFAVFSLSFFNEQIHQMSIFGIIIAIGLLIDNAIVITDEIRINLLDSAYNRLEAMVVSVRHLFAPLLASTLTTILGFMPIFLLDGNIGDFIGPIAISVVMALIGSLFISLTIIAALAARFLPRHDDVRSGWLIHGVQMPDITSRFARFLGSAIRRPLLVLPLCIVLPVAGFVLSGQLGNVFFPSADRDQFEVYVWLPQGSTIQQTYGLVQEIDGHISDQEAVTQVTWLVGGSAPSVYYNQVMTRDNSPHFANAVISTLTVKAASVLITELQSELQEQFPEAKIVVRPFGQGPPISAPVAVDIYGPDLTVLNELGEQVRLAMSDVPGITQSTASITLGEPELIVQAQRDTALLSQLSLQDIASQLQTALTGQLGGSILESTEEVPVRVRLSNQQRGDLNQVSSVSLLSPELAAQQSWLPLDALGEFSLQPALSGITRTNGERVNQIEAYLLPSMPAVDASNILRDKIEQASIFLPEGYRIKMAGDADEQQKALGKLGTYAPVLLVLMVSTLVLTFSSVKLATVIVTVAGLSVGLGMLSLWFSGLPIGFNPLLGCAGLIGVAINGSIVVIAAINANPQAQAGNTKEIVKETMGCSRHILSTTFTTVGGLIPLLLFSEGTFWPPLAVVLAGGVGFSVLLSLVFTPTIVAMLGRRSRRKEPQLQGNPITA